MKDLLGELQKLQKETIDIVSSVTENIYKQQFHSDLSPLGWHLGHCTYTESYWIREQLLGQHTIDGSLKSLYVPELNTKSSRGASLPDKSELLEWAKITQVENRALLESEFLNKNSHKLLDNNYLLYFLAQHYSQHIEIMQLVLTEMQLQELKPEPALGKKLIAEKLIPNTSTIETDIYKIGSNEKSRVYDNEQPAHSLTLNSFKISILPVSNSEYLQFINDGAYLKKELWSDEGWQWIKKNQYRHPHHWRIKNDSLYYAINHQGSYELEENHPVHGLSYYEAEAYANWSGARLPHEYEWEVASKKACLQQSELIWEWCSNIFSPYKNFSAYPYEGYSLPYFDNNHYVLRGGSSYTKKWIKRHSFRNYYTADKRHIYAGVRLAY